MPFYLGHRLISILVLMERTTARKGAIQKTYRTYHLGTSQAAFDIRCFVSAVTLSLRVYSLLAVSLVILYPFRPMGVNWVIGRHVCKDECWIGECQRE